MWDVWLHNGKENSQSKVTQSKTHIRDRAKANAKTKADFVESMKDACIRSMRQIWMCILIFLDQHLTQNLLIDKAFKKRDSTKG